MQIKINKIPAASFFACMLIGVLFFSSCKKETEDAAVQLKVFGPSPALRGGQLKFIGTNMDKVTAVILPTNLQITDITKTGTTEISVTIPQDAVPGKVVLKTPQGDITTKTLLAFTEPITIDSYSPVTVKAGDKLTLNGDYLNLITQVIFQSGVVVESNKFMSQTRKKIEVTVPITAQTGKVAVSNGAAIPVLVYTAADVQVTLPKLTAMTPNPVKPGSDLTITGTDFQLVKSVIFSDALAVTNFTVNAEKTSITVKVPATAKEGTVKLVAQSGVEVVSATALNLVMPVIASVAPTTVKNGGEITVKGTDLDLIDKVIFGGGKEGAKVSGGTATELKVTIPNDAVSGVVKFTTKSTKEVAGPSLILLDPVLTSFEPSSAKAKSDITITGTNLDLVVDVVFVGGVKGVIASGRTENQLVVTVPVGAKNGKITLIAKNGNQVQSSADLTVLANLPLITSFTESKGTPGQILTLNGTNMLLIKELIFPGDIKATAYGLKSDTKVEVYVPTNVSAGYGKIKLLTYEGEEGLSPEIFIGGTDPVADPKLMIVDCVNADIPGNWGGNIEVAEDPAIAFSGKYIHGTAAALTGWSWLWGNNWYSFPSVSKADHVFKMDVNLTKPFGSSNVHFQMEFGGNRIDLGAMGIKTPTTVGWVTVTIDLAAISELPATIPSNGEWGINFWYADGPVNITGLYIDNMRFESK